MDNNPKLMIIVGILIALLLIGGAGFWYWQKKAGAPETPVAEVKDGLGAKALEKTNNPLSGELPETNPFQVNTNPFK